MSTRSSQAGSAAKRATLYSLHDLLCALSVACTLLVAVGLLLSFLSAGTAGAGAGPTGFELFLALGHLACLYAGLAWVKFRLRRKEGRS
ncbi:hypothetical protein [Sphingomonas lacusdianchii]|uniref:hypothetical protein n=1 Tax=Sphingomonas lacusdianchii TaxID=2917992 RepID=UPI001F5A75A6|nr:hypothetical protein [Sphingomonas sp. JXJ CY 53]